MNAGEQQSPAETPTVVQTLYVFPHAGGSAGSYVPFSRAFSADMRRIAVQYPGRTDRHDVQDIASIPALADDVYTTIASQTAPGTDVGFFGHSMGGLVAFEVARRFESADQPIAALFLSASPAPGSAGYEYLNQSSDDQLLRMVTDMTGMDAQFIDERFGATILRTLRSYGTITDYRCPPGTTISCPIYAYAAADDTVVSHESVSAWSDFTTSDFALRVLPGNHFYVTHDVQALVEDIQRRIAPSPSIAS